MSTQNGPEAAHPRRMSESYAADYEPDPLSAAVYYDGIRMKRVFAFLIDVCILVALGLAWWGVGFVVSLLTFFATWPLVLIGAALLPIAYHSFMIGGERHATFGMRAMGIRVAVWNGHNPTLPQALLQTVLFYVTVSFTNGLILLVSLFNDRGRCLHDYLCGTVTMNVIDGPVIMNARA